MRILIAGTDSIHVKRYIELVKDKVSAVHWVCDKAPTNSPVPFTPVNFSLRNPLAWWITVKEIRRIIDEFQPDLVHIHQVNSVAWYVLRALQYRPLPSVLTAWGSDIFLLPHSSTLMHKMVVWCLRHANAWTADSMDLLNAMNALCSAEKKQVLVANFGIDLPEVKRTKENIIYSNRLHTPLYRITDVIKAFALFTQTAKGAGWNLMIAGEGSETEMLKSLVKLCGIEQKVEFTGWVDKRQNAEYYARARLYVSIPFSDGTASSLLEAMSFGCLPIVSDLASNREWILHGQNGYVVKDVSLDFFTAALQIDEINAGKLNFKIIEEKATRSVNRERFIQLYGKLLDL
jgi:glycosyltransferase involved in cell wall biosynthesis